MAKFRVEIEDLALKHIQLHKKSGDKKTINRIERILFELSEHPYVGIGQPEALKYEMSGFWSRRINQKDRMIYVVDEKIITVTVITAITHYFK